VPVNRELFRKSAALAARSAVVFALATFAAILLRAVLDGLFGRRWFWNWQAAIALSAILGMGCFCVLFVYWAFTFRAALPADEILMDVSPNHAAIHTELSGFVAMEYFALILNRTFVVFIAPDRVYGWKAEGPVSTANPRYFEEYAKMLDDPLLMRDVIAVGKLAELPGGFTIARPEILSVEVVHKQKWGMAAIAHSGRIVVRLTSGRTREFILLGNVDGEHIKRTILS
jgi:hypothetical protein